MRQIASLALAVVALMATVSAPAAATMVQTSEQPGLVGPGDAPTAPDGLGELLAEHDCRPVGNGSYNHYQCTVDGVDLVVDLDSFRTGDGFDTDNPFLAADRSGQLPSDDDLSVGGVETERVHPGPAHLETLDANDDSWIYRHVGDDGGTVWTDNVGDSPERDFNASDSPDSAGEGTAPGPSGTEHEVCENCGSDEGPNISYSASDEGASDGSADEPDSPDDEQSVPDSGENAEEVCENCGSDEGPNISYSVSNGNGTESNPPADTETPVPDSNGTEHEVCENCGSDEGPNISYSVSGDGDGGDEHPVCGWCNNPHVPDVPHDASVFDGLLPVDFVTGVLANR